jgi:hypothetical protein
MHSELAEAVRKAKGEAWSDRVITASALQRKEFPPLKFILPGLVPEGATLLVSRPKLGKSWLVLDLAISIAAGRFTLGELRPAQGDVLYLALEDGQRRLQRRISRILPTFSGSWPERLTIATEWSRADQGGLADIKNWIATVSAPRAAIVDTLAQFRAMSTGKNQLYADDYQAIIGLQKLAIAHGIGVIIVHHDRKSEADDPFDTVSGSLGLTGAADTILIMKRQAGGVTLHVRGRDLEESEIALQFDKATCRWSMLGTAAEVNRSAERKRVLEVLSSGALAVKDILIRAELRSRNATDQLVYKMVQDGQIVRTDRGHYALPEGEAPKPGKIDKKERSDIQRSEIQAKVGDLTNLSDLTDLDIPPFLRRPANPTADASTPPDVGTWRSHLKTEKCNG